MKSLEALCAAIIATSSLANSASAQTFSPPGTISLSSVGPMSVSKGLRLSCNLTGSGQITGGSATITSLALTSGGLCSSVMFVGLPYVVTAVTTNSVTINNMQVIGLTGNCAGNLTGAFNQSTGRATFNNAVLPSNPPGGTPCIVSGVVATSPAVSFTIP